MHSCFVFALTPTVKAAMTSCVAGRNSVKLTMALSRLPRHCRAYSRNLACSVTRAYSEKSHIRHPAASTISTWV